MAYPIDPFGPQYAPYVGYFNPAGPQDSVIDADNLYLSAEGPALRHYKDETGTQFWDEVLYSSQTVADPTAPLGGTGTGYPS